jgi:hypothetical protein
MVLGPCLAVVAAHQPLARMLVLAAIWAAVVVGLLLLNWLLQ